MDTTTTVHILRHTLSGEKYAATLDEQGQVVTACGPLPYGDTLEAIVYGFDSDTDVVTDLNTDRDMYVEVD